MITVMAATGRIGKKISELLLSAGKTVRAVGRSASKSAATRRIPRPHDLRTSQTSWHAPTRLRENHAHNNLLAGSLAIGASL